MNLFSRIGTALKTAVTGRLPLSASSGGFEGAMSKRRLIAWKATEENINSLVADGGDLLRARSRQIVRSNPYAANAANSFASNAIGDGIRPSSLIEDIKLKQAVLQLWKDWSLEADADGLTDFSGMQALVAHALFEAGEGEVKRFLESHPNFPRNRNGEFHFQNVENMLRRVAYAGYVHLPKWGINYQKAKHEALISFETWQKIQDRLDGSAKERKRPNLEKSFPLRGFVLCDHCGRPVTASFSKGDGGRYPYYICQTKGCPLRGKSIPKQRMEEDFEELLNEMRPTKQLFVLFKAIIRRIWEKESLSEQEAALVLQKQLQELEKKETQMLDRLLEAESSSLVRVYEKRVEEIDAQKIILRERIGRGIQSKGSFQEIYRTALDFLENPQKLWVSGDLIAQKTVLKLAFDEKLRYRKNEGYRTALTSRPFRFFGS